jgi:hypothetical protein
MRREIVASLALAWLVVSPARAQSALRGRVIAAEAGSPLTDARVSLLRSGTSTSTDRFGQFAIRLAELPDTLVIASIGRVPDSLPITQAPDRFLVVALAASPVPLSDLIVSAPAGADLIQGTRWELPLSAARMVPPAVETDVFRALAMIPAVSFTTPLSSRPIIRGYDANESSYRLDGFELVNPYHLGRILSAFPAEAADHVSLTAAPFSATEGGSLAGIVDITGRNGAGGGTHGGGNFSLLSLSPWAGGGQTVPWFVGLRVVHLQISDLATGERFPYTFQDVYTSASFQRGGVPRGRITAFASRDRLADRDEGTGMDWNNILVGGRWNLVDRSSGSLEILGTVNGFSEDVENIFARKATIDLRNRFFRAAVGANWTFRMQNARVSLGLSAARRSIENRIVPVFGEFPSTDVTINRTEGAGHIEATHKWGKVVAQLGLRLDASGSNRVLQPRASLRAALSEMTSLSIGVGRTSRLYHIVSDPTSEPDIAFYEFWLSAGENGVPIPTVDQVTADLDWQRGQLVGRFSLFGSRSRGLAELRPETEEVAEGENPFRFGEGKTWGLETQIGIRGSVTRANSLSLTYVLSGSNRKWADEWVPWVLRRRHLVRLFGQIGLGSRWTVFGTVEGMTGAPVTPVSQVVIRRPCGCAFYRFGPENSVTGPGTLRLDLGTSLAFQGPWKSRMWFGISVINFGWGAVAPVIPSEPARAPAAYERLFNLPAIPTLTLRAEF